MKGVMTFAYRRAPRTTLAYAVNQWFKNLHGENAFEPAHFVGNVYAVHGAPAIVLPLAGAAVISQWCQKLRLPIGLLAAGDLVRYASNASHTSGFGIVVGFARLELPGSIVFVVALKLCVRTADTNLKISNRHGLITSDQVSAAVPYVEFGGSFAPASHV